MIRLIEMSGVLIMKSGKEMWDVVKSKLKAEMSPTEFSEIFEPISDIHKIHNNYIFLVVPDFLTKYRIEKFYLARMNSALEQLEEVKHNFKLITKEASDKENVETQKLGLTSVDAVDRQLSKRNLRSEYTFDNFVTGGSNRFAYLNAIKVAESPHVTINPLYIFGDVGLGKTHLMMAIGHYVLDNNINANVIYTTAQQFAEDYFLATNKKNVADIEKFYDYHRSADILLVDDIQFLSGKNSTQEEFFKVFEHLFDKNKQIVITSDRAASDLDNMMARLKSRFNWGMIVDIKNPDLNLRISILQRKLSFLIPNPSEVPLPVLEFIATTFDQNIRDLEGALRRFVSFCVSFNLPFTVDSAKQALEGIVPKNKLDSFVTNDTNIDKIKQTVSNYYKISIQDLESASRKQHITYPRQVAIYLIRSRYDIPLKKIGEFFGNRDHATISHSYDKIINDINTNQQIKNDIEIIESKIDDSLRKKDKNV